MGKRVLFLFPGNGIHQKNMLANLSKVTAGIKQCIENIAAESDRITGLELLDESVENPLLNQIRIFASEVALYEYWRGIGCTPVSLIGHSLGENAASYCAGLFSLEDMIILISERQKFLERSVGILSMCAVNVSEKEVKRICSEHGITLEISARNSPNRVTVVGADPEIQRLCGILKERKTDYFQVQAAGGSHCSFFEKHRDEFMDAVSGLHFERKESIMISTVFPGGDILPSESAEYWFRHMTDTVDFAGAMKIAVKKGADIAIDLGVTPNLLGSAMLNAVGSDIKWLPSVRFGTDYKKRLEESTEKMKKYLYEEN